MTSRPSVSNREQDPSNRRDPIKSLTDLIAKSRLNLPYNVAWDDNSWEISDLNPSRRAHLDHANSLVFAQHQIRKSLPRTDFESPYADLIKALVVQRRLDRGMGAGTQKVFLRAARYLYDALPLPVRRDPTQITRSYFNLAESPILGREKPSSAYRAAKHLEEIAHMLDRHRLTRIPVEFNTSIRKPQDQYDRTSATFEARSSRLPTAELLDALAKILNDPKTAEDPFDELLINIIVVFFLAGFRAGELLTIPANCLITWMAKDDAGNIRLDALSGEPVMQAALRYWPEKGGKPLSKPIPTEAVELLKRALSNIERLCGPARENAKWLQANPGRVNINLPDEAILSSHEICRIIGSTQQIHSTAVREWFKAKHRAHLSREIMSNSRREISVTGRTLKSALACDRYDKSVFDSKDGRQQALGDTLLVIFKNAGHSVFATSKYISEPVTWAHVQDFIVGRKGLVASIFERHGYLKDDGTPMRVNTHDFRRLLNTIGHRGGLSQVEIADWMGRRRIQDNATYDLRSAAELARDTRDLIKQNAVFGIIADQVNSLPSSERDAFLAARLTMLHRTPLGGCGSNIAENPCMTAISCLGGCRHYLRRKNDPESRRQLLKIIEDGKITLARANAADAIQTPNAANWIFEQERIIATATAALAIDDDASFNDGEMVEISPNGPVLGRPIEKV